MSTKIDDLRSTYESLASCCLHEPQWSPDDVADVLCAVWRGEDTGEQWKPGEKTCTESQSYTVVKLADGRYGLMEESEDYTGHGCQCGSTTAVYATLDELITMGIPEPEAQQAIMHARSAG